MRKTIAVIGEGITEKYYIESLKGLSPFTVLPKELGMKASSLSSLEKAIKGSTKKGFDEIYCLIDMDGKSAGKNKSDYLILKKKYHNKTFSKKSEGLESKVFFIETERCIELWFLYYFTKGALTRKFSSYSELEKELRKYRPSYEKSNKYFKSLNSIHNSFEGKTPKGSITQAFKNSKASLLSNSQDKRGYSYSEMHVLIEALGIYSDKK